MRMVFRAEHTVRNLVKLLPVDVAVLDQILIPDVVQDDLTINFSGTHPIRSYPCSRRGQTRKGLGI